MLILENDAFIIMGEVKNIYIYISVSESVIQFYIKIVSRDIMSLANKDNF